MLLSGLLSKILPHLPGCHDELAVSALRDAGRTFARESDIITETVTVDKQDLDFNHSYLPGSAQDERLTPLHFLFAKTNAADSKKADVTYSCLPLAGTDHFPDGTGEKYSEAIVSQALFRLMNMPGKPWSNPTLAQYHLANYRIELGNAIRDHVTCGRPLTQTALIAPPL